MNKTIITILIAALLSAQVLAQSSTAAPCWTCPSGYIHWYDAGYSSAPGGDRCACVPISSPTTTNAPNSRVVKNNKDVSYFSSPGGTSCTHSSTYSQVGQGRPSVLFSFPLSNVKLVPGSSYALLDLKSSRCANSDRIRSIIGYANPSYSLAESGSQPNYCTQNLQITSLGNSTFRQNNNGGCSLSRQIDVTAAIYAARSAGKTSVTFIVSTLTDNDASNPNFCNRFVNPNVSPFFDSSNNCGVLLDGRETVPSSFYLTLVNTASSPVAPTTTTSSPVTSSPSTTGSPAPCWTCSSGQIHWYDAGLSSAPGGDRCACVPDSNRGCWTCPPNFIHWFDAGLSSAPGGDRCACVRRSRTLAGKVF